MWTAIVITCYDRQWADALRLQTPIIQKTLNTNLPCMILEDPVPGVGSGGATLNALYVTVERLSHIRGHSTVTTNVLLDSHILIIHHGRDSCYWPHGKMFFPSHNVAADGSGLQTYLEYLVNLSTQLKLNAPPGVWVASTDLLLHGELQHGFDWSVCSPDVLFLAVPSAKEDAHRCGLLNVDEDSVVAGIQLQQEPCDRGTARTIASVAGGIMFLGTPVVDTLLSLCTRPPIHCCTYIGSICLIAGSDNGDDKLKLSLYHDLLGPLYRGSEKQPYISGLCANSHSELESDCQKTLLKRARALLWDQLSRYRIHAFNATGLGFVNWTDDLPLEKIIVPRFAVRFHSKVLHSCMMRNSAPPNRLPMSIVNSLVEPILDESELFIVSSLIRGGSRNQNLRATGRAFIISAQLDIDQIPEFHLNENCCTVGYTICVDREFKQGMALFSSSDIPKLPYNHANATVFGMTWTEYFAIKGIRPNDVWASDDDAWSLFTARLFPIAENLTSWRNLLWLQPVTGGLSRLESWRAAKRYSMLDFLRLRDPVSSFRFLRRVTEEVVSRGVSMWPSSLMPYLRRACNENWTDRLLTALDEAALKGDRSGASRALAAISDLLSFMAGPDCSLRSGPACNREWLDAFNLLENFSLEEGVLALAIQRNNWLNSSDRLIRAARHYERAVHILIRQTVNSVRAYMADHQSRPTTPSQPAIGIHIEAVCPARIDLAGGWSDTPPVCYEMGGSVVNVAILVNGEKPIRAKGRRIEAMHLLLILEDGADSIVISSMEDLMNFSNPSSPGALMKAALVCARVAHKDDPRELPEQLRESLGSGLELVCESKLPQGSGLGTSSILASALLAVIYAAMGIQFNRFQLVHGVLNIEQLLTTGGGWQDQVGGIMGGCNRGFSLPGHDVQVHVEPIPLTESITAGIHLLLIYTGQVRLARNLLQNVIRQWYARDDSTLTCFRSLIDNATECQRALRCGDFTALGRSIDAYWSQKKIIAPGCEPLCVGQMMEIMSPYVYGQCLAGAGGGGFYYALLKQPANPNEVKRLLAPLKGAENFTVYSATFDRTGISMTIDANAVQVL